MSVTDLPSAADPAPLGTTPPRRKGSAFSTWARILIACLVLVTSGGLRLLQMERIEARVNSGRRPVFDLNELPMDVGPWKGHKTDINPEIAKGTGADVVVTRRYVNQDTGVAVELILLYGPAVNMFIHSPEACYPSAGYSEIERASIRPIKSGKAEVPFRSLVYGKGEGVALDLQEVYYTWRYNDRWTPDVGEQKALERVPGMYKVHVARALGRGERRDVGNPCEALLNQLIPDLERRIEAANTTAAAPPSNPMANNH